MNPKDIAHLLQFAALEGAERHLAKNNQQRQITKAAAYRLYGRANIDRWMTEGLVMMDEKLLDRQLLAKVAQSSNRTTYLMTTER